MARYDYVPSEFNGADLTAGNYALAFFRGANGPGQTRSYRPVNAAVVGLGDRYVRSQPKGATWELHILLTNIDETDLDSFYEDFSEEAGLVTLKVTDGDAVVWRVDVTMIRIRRVWPKRFIVDLWVPDPTFAADTLTTDSNPSTSGDTDSDTVTNTGNRKAKPTLTFSPISAKTKYFNDYRLKTNFMIVNRSPFFWNNLPIFLTDAAGSDSSQDHAALVGKTQTRALCAEAVDATETEIDYDGGVNGNPPVAGIGYIEDEQIAWSGGGGGATGTLTGVKRGVGGTAADTHADNSIIQYSEGLENGDDVRVWANHVEVKRWLSGVNTAALRIVINVSMPPSKSVRLKNDITGGSPASGGDLEVKDDISDYPESGVLYIGSSGSELITYQSKDVANRTFKTIERGAWRTGTLSESEDDPVYRVDVIGRFTCGKGDADQPPDPIAYRPAIQLGATTPSTNGIWRWGEEADDSLTVFYDPDEPDRTAMFRPSYEVPTKDGNSADPLRLDTSTTKVAWKDSAAAAGKPLVGRLAIFLPQAIEADTNTIAVDIQRRSDMRMRVLGRDAEGLEVELADEQDFSEPAAAQKTITPASAIHTLILNGVRAATLGSESNNGSQALGSSGDRRFQKVIVAQETEFDSVVVRLLRSSTNDFSYRVRLRDDSGATPDLGELAASLGASRLSSTLTTAFANYRWAQLNDVPFTLQAGTYWIELEILSYVSGSFSVESDLATTKHAPTYEIGGGVGFEPEAWRFRMMHLGGGPIQPESALLNADAEASFDKLYLGLDIDASTRKVPFVNRLGALSATATNDYHCIGTFKNITTGQEIAIDLWMEKTATLTIDCEARTAILTINNEKYDVMGALTFTDNERWMDLDPGANSMEYVENDMVDNTWVVKHRSARV